MRSETLLGDLSYGQQVRRILSEATEELSVLDTLPVDSAGNCNKPFLHLHNLDWATRHAAESPDIINFVGDERARRRRGRSIPRMSQFHDLTLQNKTVQNEIV
jgi:hypothetical protein